MSNHRIGIAFFYHESHSFTNSRTTLDDFRNEGYYLDSDILNVYTGTKTEVGGFIDVLSSHADLEIVPLVCAAAMPSGVVSKATYKTIEKALLSRISQAGNLDGLLIALHGAMVVEELLNPEVVLLSKIRRLIGSVVPLATTLDMHANVSPALLSITGFHFGFKTYPHVDMYEQGIKAADTVVQQIRKRTMPTASIIKLPMLLPSVNMRTEEGPMADMIQLAKEAEQEDGIDSVSIFGGFPYSDVPATGASVLVIGNDETTAHQKAEFLAGRFWSMKERFIVRLPTVEEGLREALSIYTEKPIVLADISDNPMSCGSGDTTKLFSAFIELNKERTLFGALTDPESIAICRKAGKGATVKLELGGKTNPEYGGPVTVMARVIRISDGIFFNSGPFNKGLRIDCKGAVHIQVGFVDVLLVGRPTSANDPELFRHIGIEPTDYDIVGLKAKNHFRAAFDPLISRVIYIDAPGVSTNTFTHFPYKHIADGIWPLNESAEWP